jgi:hypothetical protein
MEQHAMPDQHAGLHISIVIASLDRHTELTRCLDSLHNALECASWLACEAIIVDQSASLYQAERQYSFPITVIAAATGASYARNIGLQYACGDHVWFLDDDAQVVRFLPVSPKQLHGQPILFAHWRERPCPARRCLNDGLLSNLWLIRISGTPFYLLPRRLAAQVGGFDEQLGPGRDIAAGEDLDLLLRARPLAEAQQPVIFIAELSHPNTPPPASKRMLYAHARGVVLARNHWHLVLAVELLYSLLAALRGDHRRFTSLLKGYAAGRGMQRPT